jgi:aspartyl-tRNA(Asn)/glutamyl-tRNA(Gln) amidotransferase subunit C
MMLEWPDRNDHEVRMTISREDVLRVAQLAHLDLSPEEIEMYRGQLDKILAYIGKLQELDVSQVEPMTQMLPQALSGTPPGASRAAGPSAAEPDLRDDVVLPCNVAADVLAHAPDAAKPYFRVPKVIER